ncbi:transglutaminase TgpA family protein [Silvimonas amylolytica]|uniref:Transglutaminase-like domain-containing protein n=1 Tax=Silvimonas amylolytica TaxID=449663 RepID=A0ABQ2PQB8_9NEIS|nr:DUF3488 and transglutaminase-like domain-containing protein [Silvimonas amylolytica]GGP27581.1 hypothetical protein GCM10010971_34000 [Silvimonas amylolytica]
MTRRQIVAMPLLMPPFYILAAAVTCALAPVLLQVPVWHSLLVLLPIIWRLWLAHAGRPVPRPVMRIGVALALFVPILLQYHTLIGREGGVAALGSLVAVKFLETSNQRDVRVLTLLAFFACSTGFLISQSPFMMLYAVVSLVLICLQLLVWMREDGHFGWPDFLRVLRMLAEALPIALILFVLFPRLATPLWRMPNDTQQARTGLSDSMEPGSISDLTQDDSVAFRVDFDNLTPQRAQMYWRGPVMELFDGVSWRAGIPGRVQPEILMHGLQYHYTITLEPTQRNWLMAMDIPVQIPSDTRLSNNLQALSRGPVAQRQQFTFTSATHWQIQNEDALRLKRDLALPKDINPQARALAAQWADLPPALRVGAALDFLRQGHYQYTLGPPLLTGRNRVDELLFQTRAGFCEHYAGAFAFLMRAAGIPARVVGGYLGGEYNRTGNYWIVRQASAHAWTEVWLDGQGWQRVDPTSVVAPERISRGLQSAVPATDPLPYLLRNEDGWAGSVRLQWDAIMHGWDKWVVGYNAERQMRVLNRLGIDNMVSAQFTILLAGGFGVVLIIYLVSTQDWRRKRRTDPAQQHWLAFERKLTRVGVVPAAGEGPLNYARRAAAHLPAQQAEILAIASQYLAIRYGFATDALPGLARAIQRFQVFNPATRGKPHRQKQTAEL